MMGWRWRFARLMMRGSEAIYGPARLCAINPSMIAQIKGPKKLTAAGILEKY